MSGFSIEKSLNTLEDIRTDINKQRDKDSILLNNISNAKSKMYGLLRGHIYIEGIPYIWDSSQIYIQNISSF